MGAVFMNLASKSANGPLIHHRSNHIIAHRAQLGDPNALWFMATALDSELTSAPKRDYLYRAAQQNMPLAMVAWAERLILSKLHPSIVLFSKREHTTSTQEKLVLRILSHPKKSFYL
jgi:hypothetical protein